MDAKLFEKEKEKILKSYAKYKFLGKLKNVMDDKVKEGLDEEAFNYNDQDEACKELNWPDESAWHDLVIKIMEEFFKKNGWEWQIHRVVSDAVPKYHYGTLQMLGGKGAAKGAKETYSQSSPDSPKKSKSKLGGLFSKKKKDSGGGKEAEVVEEEKADDDYYYNL